MSSKVLTPREEILSGPPENLRVVDGRNVIEELEMRADELLPPGASVQSARRLLAMAAEDTALAPLVKESFENWLDHKQFVDMVLAIGAVGAVWMVLSSTKVTIRSSHVDIEKTPSTASQLKAFADIIRAIRGAPQK